jgi:hypothetical protein
VPPASLIDPAVNEATDNDNVAQYLIANYQAGAPYTLMNFALGIVRPQEMGTFVSDVEPAFRSDALFDSSTVSESLISLAYYHGFLTYKPDEEQRSVLTSPNVVMQTVYGRTLFAGLPELQMEQLEALLRSGKRDTTEFERIVRLGAEEAAKTVGKGAGGAILQALAFVLVGRTKCALNVVLQ